MKFFKQTMDLEDNNTHKHFLVDKKTYQAKLKIANPVNLQPNEDPIADRVRTITTPHFESSESSSKKNSNSEDSTSTKQDFSTLKPNFNTDFLDDSLEIDSSESPTLQPKNIFGSNLPKQSSTSPDDLLIANDLCEGRWVNGSLIYSPENILKAKKIYLDIILDKSSSHGREAAANLGNLYSLGKGFPKDMDEAKRWWEMGINIPPSTHYDHLMLWYTDKDNKDQWKFINNENEYNDFLRLIE